MLVSVLDFYTGRIHKIIVSMSNYPLYLRERDVLSLFPALAGGSNPSGSEPYPNLFPYPAGLTAGGSYPAGPYPTPFLNQRTKSYINLYQKQEKKTPPHYFPNEY